MFERFTDAARRLVVVAQEESRRLNHAYIGSEHLLIAIAGEADSLGARTLRNAGAGVQRLREVVETLAGKGTDASTGHIPFTPECKKSLEQSLSWAKKLGHEHIGSEHLFLGVLEDPEGTAGKVLKLAGADPDLLRAEVVRAGSLQVEGIAAPRCPHCGALAATFRAQQAELDQDGESKLRVVLVFCRGCGAVLGTAPS